jgi:hypothetical protein
MGAGSLYDGDLPEVFSYSENTFAFGDSFGAGFESMSTNAGGGGGTTGRVYVKEAGTRGGGGRGRKEAGTREPSCTGIGLQ